MRDVKYWMNNIEGNNEKTQPQSKEEEAAFDIAEYMLQREQNKIAA